MVDNVLHLFKKGSKDKLYAGEPNISGTKGTEGDSERQDFLHLKSKDLLVIINMIEFFEGVSQMIVENRRTTLSTWILVRPCPQGLGWYAGPEVRSHETQDELFNCVQN